MNVPNPMDKGSPASPDYAGAARDQTIANRPNQNTPWASSSWQSGARASISDADMSQMLSGVPESWRGQMAAQIRARAPAGRDTQSVQLAGPLGDANDSMMTQLASAWRTPLDNGADARQHAEDAIYQRASSRLDPMWASRDHDLATTLASQGIDPNSAAYGKALENQGRSRNDAYTSALMEAIMGGGQEASRQQQLDLTSRMAPLSGMGGLQRLTGMPTPGPAGNLQSAAAQQGQWDMDVSERNKKYWQDLIRGGASIFAGGMGAGGGGIPDPASGSFSAAG